MNTSIGAGIAVALVHNNNEARNSYLLPQLEALSLALQASRPVRRMAASAQPEIKPHSKSMALLRDFIYFKLAREWSRYRELPVKTPIRAYRVFLKNAIRKYWPVGEDARRWMRNSHIETVVTDKHISLWQQFLNTDMSFLVVLEDDAVFMADSIPRFDALCRDVEALPDERPLYIDLGGGCSLDLLQIQHLESTRDKMFRHYRKPTTNTACAYMINRATAKLFVRHLVERPWLRLIGIDWMMNKLFMLSEPANDHFYCAHADPSMFQHGSTTGHYVTWQAKP